VFVFHSSASIMGRHPGNTCILRRRFFGGMNHCILSPVQHEQRPNGNMLETSGGGMDNSILNPMTTTQAAAKLYAK
jgi:hypothetical protein